LNEAREKLYHAKEFAKLTGVTVRALHHYDRLGLLKPSGRTEAGYRLYGKADLIRLQQIATLKFIGLPLKRIKEILDRRSVSLSDTLRMQREALEEQRRHTAQALAAIEKAEACLKAGDEPEFEMLRKIVEVIEMQQKWEFAKQYYSPEARAKIDERARNFTPEMQAKAQQDWADLIREVEAAVAAGEDPASGHAQSLAARWQGLIAGFTGGDPQIESGLRKLYSDEKNWPAGMKKPFSDEACAFIGQARQAGK
jgi:MerR family transcriptional regulator, thiopeptide resistance regulator